MNYDLSEHRHRFAVWTAARALRNLTTNLRIREAIEATGVQHLALGPPKQWPTGTTEIDQLHRTWGRAMLDQFDFSSVDGARYGHAAKLIAIYLKTILGVGGHEQHPFVKRLHPPVDSILLKALARDKQFSPAHRKLWRDTRWMKLDENGYFELIETLRAEGLDQPAFWMIERYWQPDVR